MKKPAKPAGPIERLLSSFIVGGLAAGFIAWLANISAHSGTMIALLFACCGGAYLLITRSQRDHEP